MEFEKENVCSLYVNPEEWRINWDILIKENKATFTHSESCECLLYVNYDNNELHYRDMGLLENFIEIIKEAKKQGFKYLLLYS